jgi:hypothetical protein
VTEPSDVTGFAPEDLDLMDQQREVEIETWSMAGEPRRTVIWVVVADAVPYVRSVRGEAGRWYREIRTEPHGALHVAGRAIPIRAVPVDDEAGIVACTDALKRKYAGDFSLSAMLRPDVLDTTLRLEPG